MVTSQLAISWTAPGSWEQVPSLEGPDFDEWRSGLLLRASRRDEREALDASLRGLRSYAMRPATSERRWLAVLTPEGVRPLRLVALAWWEVLPAVGLDAVEAAIRSAPVGPGRAVRSQQWGRARIAGRDSILLEQLVEQDQPGLARAVLERCVCVTEAPGGGDLLSLTLMTADLRAFEDVTSTCSAVLATVQFPTAVEVS